ncbi:Hypothetical protein NTJ_03188 [Nesidiocoris tenuis]|uniref:CTNNB1 binding N-teminal domain-containing protein n=1 Tax=Nesidiocoris tenuis TaxID=355587 RepID=A0ABN7AG93_9HEMI|nr:Hypothetical protein NTJ_03188 [Nesidiocoris tenuis]
MRQDSFLYSPTTESERTDAESEERDRDEKYVLSSSTSNRYDGLKNQFKSSPPPYCQAQLPPPFHHCHAGILPRPLSYPLA